MSIGNKDFTREILSIYRQVGIIENKVVKIEKGLEDIKKLIEQLLESKKSTKSKK